MSRATSNWLGWIRKTMHICGLSQYQQQVKLLAGLKWTWSELLGTVLKYLGDVFSGSWVANEGNGPFDSTHSPMWVTTKRQIYKKRDRSVIDWNLCYCAQLTRAGFLSRPEWSLFCKLVGEDTLPDFGPNPSLTPGVLYHLYVKGAKQQENDFVDQKTI